MTRRNLFAALVGLIGLGLTRAVEAKTGTITAEGTANRFTAITGSTSIAIGNFPQIVRKQFRCSAGHAWVADDYGACHIQGGGYGTVLEVSDKTIRFGGGERTLCIPCLEKVLMNMGVGEVTSEPL